MELLYIGIPLALLVFCLFDRDQPGWICDWCGNHHDVTDPRFHIPGVSDRICQDCSGASGKVIL